MGDRYTRLGHAVRHLMELAGTSPGGQATDRELIERFVRDGSQGAFADLIDRHGAMVRAVCRRHLRDVHAADDAFQATFLVLIRKAGGVRWRESIGGWLFEVASRVAKKAAGQAVRRIAREGAPPGSAPEPAASAPAADRAALRIALDEELGRLPEQFRTPLVLCYLEGRSPAEVTRHLGLTDGQLRGRLYRAKERLRRRLTRRGFALPAVLLALTVGRQGRAVSATLAADTVRLAADPSAIPVVVQQLVTGVIRDMTTTFKTLAYLALFGALGLGAAGFAIYPATADPARPEPVPPAATADTAPAKPGVGEKESGSVHSVDAARTKLFVDFDRAAGKGEDAGLTAETTVRFGGKPVPLADLQPGMRVDLVYPKDSEVPNEVRAYWPRLRPQVTAVNPTKRTVVFRFAGEQGVALDVTLPVAADAVVTLDGLPAGLADVPLGEASWLTLSSDKKSLIGVAAFSRAYDISGEVASYEPATRVLAVYPGPNEIVKLPVAADAKVVLNGEDATLADVKKYMRVLIKRSADRKTIVGIAAVGKFGPPLPRPAGR